MTSGQFHHIGINSINIERDTRQRRDLSEIDILADSIRRLGLIHPVVITREMVLVAGERRLAACKSLGWINIPAQYTDELEPSRLRAIELEENIKRQDITWQDQVRAVTEYHNLRASQEPGWTQSDTADAIGLSRQHTNRLLQIDEEMRRGNRLVIEAPRLSTAAGVAERARERRDAQALEKLRESFGIKDEAAPQESIITADFSDWVVTHKAPRFNFLHCDFPYGVESDTFNSGGAASHGGFEDTPELWEELMDALKFATENICAPSCHLMFWFAMRKGDKALYDPTYRRLLAMGWDVNPQPLVWVKSDGMGILPDPERGPRQIYETCLLGTRGDRKVIRAVANAYAAPTDRTIHMSTKPEPMLRHFFGMLVDENTVLLDPTCGSGTALRAAESLGAKSVLGVEVNSEFANLARTALERFRKLKKAEALIPQDTSYG